MTRQVLSISDFSFLDGHRRWTHSFLLWVRLLSRVAQMTRRMTLAHRAPEPQCPGQCYLAPVSTQVIVLNGVSSSDKTSIARCLQGMLTTPRLLLDIDDLIRAMPDEGIEDGSLLHVGETGEVEVAVSQTAIVHENVGYDVVVDTSHASSESCAVRIIAQASTMLSKQPSDLSPRRAERSTLPGHRVDAGQDAEQVRSSAGRGDRSTPSRATDSPPKEDHDTF